MFEKKTYLIGILLMCFCPQEAYADLDITVHPDHYVTSIDDELQQQQEVNDTPGNASLVDESEWSNQRADTIKAITNYIPGVIDQPRDGAESNRLSIRGSGLANIFQGEGLMVLQDGIPINMADGEFEFPVIDPWLIKYAEVFPGANALQYGASNYGGAINFVTPTGITGNGYDVRGEGGSFGTLHGLVSGGKQWQDNDLFGAVTGFTQDGFREQNNQETGRFNANWGWQPTDQFVNRVYVSHTHSDAEIPGAISLAQINSDPQAANPANSAGDYQRNLDITRIADKSAWTDGTDRVDTAVFYTYRALDNPVTTYEFQNNNDFGMRAKYTHQFGLSNWQVGINDYYGDADETRYRNVDGAPGAHILSRDLDALTSEAYGQLEQNLAEKFYGIVGMQASYVTRDIQQTFPAVAAQNDNFSGYSPRLGLRYDITSEDQLFANLSRSFDPPTWSDLSGGNNPGFNQLKAQTATTAEIGERGTISNLHWQAAYYHSWVRDELVNYSFPDGSTATINAARTQKDGIELGLNGDAVRDIWLQNDAMVVRAAYTYSHFTLDHDPLYGNNTVPGVPEHYLGAEVLYRHPSGFSFGPNVEWSPESSPIDLANTLYSDAYAILGLRAFWESDDHKLNFYVEGSNLLDTRYAATYNVVPDANGHDGNYFYPGEGRAFYAGFRWSI
jgi:iron complex outermembrane receptor protein